MSVTKLFYVGGELYEVKYVTPQEDRRIRGCAGKKLGRTGEILIDVVMQESAQQATMLHEIIHVVTQMYLLPRRELREEQVQALGAGLFSALTDPRNKWYLEELLKCALNGGE